MFYFTTGLLLTTVLSAVSLSFFIVGAASVNQGCGAQTAAFSESHRWFKGQFNDSDNTVYRSFWGTVSVCVNETDARPASCLEYSDYRDSTFLTPSLLHGGRIALVFTILGVVLNAVASVFTGVIGRLTARRFPHIRSRQDCIASVCALVALCCGIVAVSVFYSLAKHALPLPYQPRPDYAWILVLVGSVIDVLLAGATCLHVILPDTESPWSERPSSALERDDERLLGERIESDSEDEDAPEPAWASKGDLAIDHAPAASVSPSSSNSSL